MGSIWYDEVGTNDKAIDRLVQEGRMDSRHFAVQVGTHVLVNRNKCVLYNYFKVHMQL
jgi:hypothetical protein